MSRFQKKFFFFFISSNTYCHNKVKKQWENHSHSQYDINLLKKLQMEKDPPYGSINFGVNFFKKMLLGRMSKCFFLNLHIAKDSKVPKKCVYFATHHRHSRTAPWATSDGFGWAASMSADWWWPCVFFTFTVLCAWGKSVWTKIKKCENWMEK